MGTKPRRRKVVTPAEAEAAAVAHAEAAVEGIRQLKTDYAVRGIRMLVAEYAGKLGVTTEALLLLALECERQTPRTA